MNNNNNLYPQFDDLNDIDFNELEKSDNQSSQINNNLKDIDNNNNSVNYDNTNNYGNYDNTNNYGNYDNTNNYGNYYNNHNCENVKNKSNEVNSDEIKYYQVFEMFPNIEKSLIIELYNEMDFDNLIDLLVKLDEDKSEKKDKDYNYEEGSINLVACENVPRRRESILQTIRNRLNSKNSSNETSKGSYFELSQFDKND